MASRSSRAQGALSFNEVISQLKDPDMICVCVDIVGERRSLLLEYEVFGSDFESFKKAFDEEIKGDEHLTQLLAGRPVTFQVENVKFKKNIDVKPSTKIEDGQTIYCIIHQKVLPTNSEVQEVKVPTNDSVSEKLKSVASVPDPSVEQSTREVILAAAESAQPLIIHVPELTTVTLFYCMHTVVCI